MRAVNLIPPDARRGDRAPMRTGAVSYVVIGGLALGLLAAIALGFTSKQVSDRKAEVAQLEQELEDATAKAESLSAFANFRAIQEARTATVSSLAQSRFDWERVMNELALVIPDDVWLIQMGGTVSPSVQVEDAPEIAIRDSVPGPALELIGCATGQDAVAGFVTDLEDIDGVTRVGVASSQLPEEDSQTLEAVPVGGDSASDSSDDCRTRQFISRFEMVVAFDAVPQPATATAAPGVPAPLAPPAGGGSQLAETQTTNADTAPPGSTAEAAADQASGG